MGVEALHGGEAEGSRDAFLALFEAKQRDVIAFLENLVLFVQEEPEAAPEEAAVAAGTSGGRR